MILAVTMGEPAGIGGDIALGSWVRREAERLPPFFVIDDPDRLIALARHLGLPVPIQTIAAPDEALGVFGSALPVLPIGPSVDVVSGRLDPANSEAVVASIDRAVSLVQAGQADAVVTNPIHKSLLFSAGFPYPGHTEYLAFRTEAVQRPVMMLVVEGLRAVPVTVHVALQDALTALTADRIVRCGQLVHRALIADFGIERPRIAVAAVNPHGGEDGTLGTEEIETIAPAVRALEREGIAAFGPKPADSLFHAKARAGYDAVLCMYHDQALIPVKTIDFERGVNVTLGLPIVRTSPDHGTALDVAGTGRADPSSLCAAMRLAAELVGNRRASGGAGEL